MRVGFTGTRDGMTLQQREQLRAWVMSHAIEQFHHGCCVGADEQAATIACEWCHIIGHPPENKSLVSEDALTLCDEVMRAIPYLERNRRIVDSCHLLIACPKGPEEQRSGTWATVRYARKRARHHPLRIVIIWPDGTVT